LLAILAVFPLLIPTFISINEAFTQPQPEYARRPFYQVSYRKLIGTIKKGRGALHKDDQYNNVRRNIGTITWNGNIVLKENAVPKFIIDKQGEQPNPDYIGEVALIGPGADHGEIKDFRLDFNTIKLVYSATVPQTILLNFNFNGGWSSNAGAIEEHNGLLSLKVDPGTEKEVLLSYSDRRFTLGCYIALLAAIAYGFLFAYVRQRAQRETLKPA
jgi:hypothetical protein